MFNQLKSFYGTSNDTFESALKKMSILIIAVATTIAGMIWSLMYYHYFGVCLPFYGPVIYVCILVPTISIFFITRRESLLINVQLLCIFTIPIMMEWTGGGLNHGIVVMWAFLAPIGALIFKDILNSIYWMILFLLVIIITIVFNDFFEGFAIPVSQQGKSVMFGMNIIGPSLVTFFSMRYFVKTIYIDRKLLEKTNVTLNTTLDDLQVEKQKSDALLLNILPAEIAEELKNKGAADAQLHENVTVLFTDFIGFSNISERLTPKELVAEIHDYFTAFDEIVEQHGLEKIKTIGDAYLAVSGMPVSNTLHAKNTILAAIDIIHFVNKKFAQGGLFKIRIGIHSGPLVAGIVGLKKFAYDVWGDTVNTAARMEQNGQPNKINISQSTYNLVKHDFTCLYRGKIAVKNKGELDMYFIEGIG